MKSFEMILSLLFSNSSGICEEFIIHTLISSDSTAQSISVGSQQLMQCRVQMYHATSWFTHVWWIVWSCGMIVFVYSTRTPHDGASSKGFQVRAERVMGYTYRGAHWNDKGLGVGQMLQLQLAKHSCKPFTVSATKFSPGRVSLGLWRASAKNICLALLPWPQLRFLLHVCCPTGALLGRLWQGSRPEVMLLPVLCVLTTCAFAGRAHLCGTMKLELWCLELIHSFGVSRGVNAWVVLW